MQPQQIQVNLFDLVSPIARAVDAMSPAMADHHMRVAYLAYRIAEEADIPPGELCTIAMAASMHDVGAFSLEERIDLLEFEYTKPGLHAEAGYLLLKDFQPLASALEMIRHHHVPWRDGKGLGFDGAAPSRGSQVLHLADRIAVLLHRGSPVLSQVDDVCAAIQDASGNHFHPEFVDAARRLANRDYIWLDTMSDTVGATLAHLVAPQTTTLDIGDLLAFSRMLCRVIDFKSEFTATHTSGVAATAVAIAGYVGFPEGDCRLIEVASFLHDLGKLAVPSEILEKPGKLTNSEWQVMRTHVYYTYKILEPIEALRTIATWGSLHQERINGSGYPFACANGDIPMGSRIVAVADVFTALTEDRPYRVGMDKEGTLAVLARMGEEEELDPGLLAAVQRHYAELDSTRAEAQRKAREEYDAFREALMAAESAF